jgi:hypothetical protein
MFKVVRREDGNVWWRHYTSCCQVSDAVWTVCAAICQRHYELLILLSVNGCMKCTPHSICLSVSAFSRLCCHLPETTLPTINAHTNYSCSNQWLGCQTSCTGTELYCHDKVGKESNLLMWVCLILVTSFPRIRVHWSPNVSVQQINMINMRVQEKCNDNKWTVAFNINCCAWRWVMALSSSFHLTTLSIPHVGITECRKLKSFILE